MEFSLYFPPEYLRAGLLVSLLSVWLLVGLFAYLNHYTKRRHFTMWTAAWLFYALWLTLDFGRETKPDARAVQMVREWCVGVSAVFLFWGSLVFLGQKQRQVTFALFMLFLLAWSYVAAYHVENPLQAKVPIFFILGAASMRTAHCYFVYRRHRPYLGATLLTLGLTLWGVFLGGYPFWETQNHLRAFSFFLCGVLQLFIAVSMIVLVLEETRTNTNRLRESNRSSQEACAGLKDQVRSSEDRYRKLFEQASDAIIITTADNLDILELNQRAQRLLMIGPLEKGRPSLRSFLEGLPGGEAALDGAKVFEHLRHQRTLSVIAAHGGKTPVEVEGSAIEFEGQPAYQFALREVTERVRLEQQLRQAEKLSALGRMISGIAHELNNPLAVIKGYLDLVLSRDRLSGPARQGLEKAAEESSHAAKLVGCFLSFARGRPCVRRSADLNQLVERAVERARLETETPAGRAEIRLGLAPGLPTTLADPDQLAQVLDNLLQNALQALADHSGPGVVRLKTEHKQDVLRIWVEDNGPGVPEHLASKIFEPFFTTKEVGKGTGLGLSISHSIVSEHQGRLYYQPSALGGACFVMELPLTREAPAPGLQPPAPAPAPPKPPARNRPRRAHILILDDEAPLAEMLGQLVRHLGHESTLCCSPLEALDMIAQTDFDLILSDYRMPALDGRQFYHRVSQLKPHLVPRIVFLTGDVANEDTQDFLASIANACITKPFQLRTVETAINGALHSSRRVSRMAGTHHQN